MLSAADNAVRILRRGLPGEPRTLDPQLADDDFSFQVVRDLYEGLTAENPLRPNHPRGRGFLDSG